MKKWILLLCVCCLSVTLHAQKMYSTKSGQIKLNAGMTSQSLLGVNEQVESRWLESNGQIIFSAKIQDFRFDNKTLGERFSETYLESSKFSKLDFKGFINDIQHIDLTAAGGNEFSADGNLSIHGVSKKVLITGSLTILSSGKIMLKSDLRIRLKDFNIIGSDIGTKIAPDMTISIYCIYE